jgi:hypothetical protein
MNVRKTDVFLADIELHDKAKDGRRSSAGPTVGLVSVL